MLEEFARRRGYSLLPFLSTFAGRVVGSDGETGKFRADFDRTLWDLYRDVHFATVSRLLREAGLTFTCEPYVGPWQVGDPLAGPWTVQFDPAWGGPAKVEFAQLDDWMKRPEPGIRHDSGTATYRLSFTGTAATTRRPCFLDLGQVNYLARVRINDRDLGVVWTAPWGVTVPAGLLKVGQNSVEIDVTNVWANRLIGDEQEPADCEWLTGHLFGPNLCGGRYLKRFPDWFVKRGPRPSRGRYCFTTWNYFSKDSPLMPSGLLGPVRLLEEG